MSTKIIKAIASPMTGCPAWTIAVFKAEDVPEGTEVFPAAPVQAQEPYSWVLENGSYLGMERGAVNPWKGSAGAFPLYRAPVQPVAVPDGLRKAFVTLESCDARYSIVMKFNQKTDAFAAHDFLLGVGGKDYNSAAPAAQGDAKDEVYEFAAKVIELFDDATMQANHMLDAGECASIIRALKSTEIAAIDAKAAS